MEDKLRIYTDLSISQSGEISLKRYLKSISRDLPENWVLLKDEKYVDQDTFKILNEVVCLKTPFFTNQYKKLTYYGKVFFGLTDDSIFVLKVDIQTVHEIPKIEKVEEIGYIIYVLHEEVLKRNKYYHLFHHKFEFGGPHDENWYKMDLRDTRSIRLYAKSENKSYTLAKGSKAEFNNKTVLFTPPNNISISLNLMKKSFKRAKELHKKLVSHHSQDLIKIDGKLKPDLYDYFEEIITCITFSYISVEAMSNAAIPEDYEHEIINEKGVKEIWPKSSIERWMSTSSKVSEILPVILQSSDIKKELFWNKFKELERLRNEIVHQKTLEEGTQLDTDIFKELINPNVFEKVKSSISVIQFFYNLDNAHPYFPLGLGIAKFQIEEIESTEKHFTKKLG